MFVYTGGGGHSGYGGGADSTEWGVDAQKALSPKVLSLVRGGCQLVISRGPEGPQGGVRMEVREVTGGQSM